MTAAIEQTMDVIQPDPSHSYRHAVAVTTSDTVELIYVSKSLFVGGTGTLTALMADGTTVLFTGVLAGQILPLRVRRVNATGTTATNIVAMW